MEIDITRKGENGILIRGRNDITRGGLRNAASGRLGQGTQNKNDSKLMIGVGGHEACSEFCLLVLDEVKWIFLSFLSCG